MTPTHQRIDGMNMQQKAGIRRGDRALVGSPLVVWSFALLAGCQSLGGPLDLGGPSPNQQASADDNTEATTPTVPVSTVSTITNRTKETTTQVVNFVTGREQENHAKAKQLYQEADKLFRLASSQPKGKAKETFAKAAKKFGQAGEAAPGSALEQDGLFMQAESLFFADRLMEATDAYQKLQTEFPRNRHIDRVASRLFSISRYWIETVKKDSNSIFKINLTDSKRPRVDVDGHAIRVLDQIRYDDPTGRLADDATMAIAAEYIRQEKFDEADEFLTDLRDTFSDSEHLFLAYLLGIRTKLEVYAGPAYSGLVLEEAETLVRQIRDRFPDKLTDAKYSDMVARASAEISFLHAERIAYRAEYREKKKEYGAARMYYRQLLEEFADTPHADNARQRLAKIDNLPAVPQQRLAWLTTIFPDEKRSEPLQTQQPKSEDEDEAVPR
jgi:outer membrane protein assembly factor BamD (BamD/ComL family)